jgi:hypothetical protein
MNPTCCIGNTGRYSCAGIYTSVPSTRLVTDFKRCTVNICPTILFLYHWLRNWFTAFKIGISSMFWYACANASVIASITNSIGSTGTRIYTFFIATSKCCMALWICQTLIGLAFYIGTTFVSSRTLTPGFMHINCAESLDATLLKGTWVLTLSLDTCLSQRTFIITLTAS